MSNDGIVKNRIKFTMLTILFARIVDFFAHLRNILIKKNADFVRIGIFFLCFCKKNHLQPSLQVIPSIPPCPPPLRGKAADSGLRRRGGPPYRFMKIHQPCRADIGTHKTYKERRVRRPTTKKPLCPVPGTRCGQTRRRTPRRLPDCAGTGLLQRGERRVHFLFMGIL